jgi:hypothetical protein
MAVLLDELTPTSDVGVSFRAITHEDCPLGIPGGPEQSSVVMVKRNTRVGLGVLGCHQPSCTPADFFDILEALGVETKQAIKAIRPDSDPEWGSAPPIKRSVFPPGSDLMAFLFCVLEDGECAG